LHYHTVRLNRSRIRNFGLDTPSFTSLLATLFSLLFAHGEIRAQQPSLSPSLQELFVKGVEALKSNQLSDAEEAFQRVLHEGGKVSFVYNNLGIVYQQRGEHQRAVDQFREAIRLQPDYAAPRILLGSSLLVLNAVPEAIHELERAVKLQPREPLARLQLAKAYQHSDNFPGIVEQYQALREFFPQEPEYAYQLGNAYMKMALWCHQQIRRINPRSVRLYQTLGENFRLQGRIEPAVRYLQLASQADPKTPGIHLSLAQIYLDQGKPADALKEVELELAIVPESAAALALGQKISSLKPKP
jgi:tetratricopeptide (TPR) repeat protein